MSNSPLVRVIGQSARIHGLIKQATEELSSGRPELGYLFADGRTLPASKRAIVEDNAALRRLLQDVSERLTTVNQTLQMAMRDDTLVNYQLAAAVEQEQAARKAALHDRLTGLPNRTLLNDRLEHGIAQAKRHHWILAVMFVDLDNFKSINDTYGHQTGDTVLQAVAKRLAHNARVDDTVSRYGGDEFLCLLTPLQEHKDIAMIAAKLLKALQEPYDVRAGEVILDVGASIGISVYPKDGTSAVALINRADEAMYEAKQRKSGFAFAE